MKTSSATIVFQNGTVILPDRLIENGVVVCRAGRIKAVGKAGRVALPAVHRSQRCIPDRLTIDSREWPAR